MIAHTDQLEREIEASRSRLNVTLSSLQDRLHPTTVADELIGSGLRSDAGGDLYGVTLDTVRRNPVPILLICAGVAWLLSSIKQTASNAPREEGPVPMIIPVIMRRRTQARIYPVTK